MKENKMKPKRTQRHTGPNWQGKGVSAGDKAALSKAKPTRVSSPVQVKPFAGKVFYLDLPSNRTAETLESDIKDLGGIVEKFFSKEIKYLVSNKREARYVHCLRQDSPVPSPDSGPSSPHPQSKQQRPGSHGDIKSRSQTDTFVPSRGKSLVERVVKEQERVKMNKILSNALEWGVKILYIDDIMAYVQKKKKIVSSQCPAATAHKTSVKAESAAKQGIQKYKAGRISKPFIKVEDSSRHYRPIYLTMSDMPEFNLQTLPPCTPFCLEDKNPPGNKQLGHKGAKASASEERAHGRKKRDKKRGGYCECCMVKYENVTTHLKSERHKAFSKSDEYLVLDKLVSNLHCNFIHINTPVKRPKCSVSSVLFVPGPNGKTGQRHKGDVDSTEIIKEEQHRTVDGQEGSYPGQTRQTRSVTGLAPLNQREGERRSFDTHTDRSKHKSLARKRPCRQNSLTSCTQKAEQAESPQHKMETAPSRGECPPSIPSRVSPVSNVDQIRTQDMKNSHFHYMLIKNEASSTCLNVTTNQQEECDKKQHSSVFEAVQDGNISPDKMTGNIQSETEAASVPSQSISPVRKIQRKAKVYKRKRRKVDTHVGRVKPSDIPDNCMLKLWDLFLSSDDMDVEFLGFED
ncbi:protein DBF4 homolog A [Centropristis striata]|uniref:protein DBF4 homolog A n=1 Tax=Centropristis striata TaxID=184440 RepID=UPI0027E2051B|nr:protein DBF4 homolog A [Centropristis striata]